MNKNRFVNTKSMQRISNLPAKLLQKLLTLGKFSPFGPTPKNKITNIDQRTRVYKVVFVHCALQNKINLANYQNMFYTNMKAMIT